MSINPDPSKQAQDVLFSNKAKKTDLPNIILMATWYKKVPKTPWSNFG